MEAKIYIVHYSPLQHQAYRKYFNTHLLSSGVATEKMFTECVLDKLLSEFQYAALLLWQENLTAHSNGLGSHAYCLETHLKVPKRVS